MQQRKQLQYYLIILFQCYPYEELGKVFVVGGLLSGKFLLKYQEYRQRYGSGMLNMPQSFAISWRHKGMEVLLAGDVNGYTLRNVGWNGREPWWSEASEITYTRDTKCKQKSVKKLK